MRLLITALCLVFSSSVGAVIGTVTDASTASCSIMRNKNKMSGVKGSGIESMDTYVTGGCVANITFKDDTRVKITENSRLLIDDFVFDPKQSDAGKLALKVGMGTVRYASGQIAKNNPQQVNIKTPTASIAVRGTDFTMTVDETGQSLVVLVPSCKDPKDVKRYELDEQRCKVGKIEVSTLSGTVTLDQAFEGTFVASASMSPTPPTIINTVEGKIGNNLIIVKPSEIQQAIKEQNKSKQDRDREEMEDEATRRLAQMIKNSAPVERPVILPATFADGNPGCNPRNNVCVVWEKNISADIQSRGKGIAYRITENEHYAEVKTQGYVSNTLVIVTQNDNTASALIGDGSPGGNMVNISQSNGLRKK